MKSPLIICSITLMLLSACKKETVVTTKPATGITQTTAQCGGSVEGSKRNKIIYRGVCWSNSPNPTIDYDNKVDYNETQNGYGEGEFTSSLTGLQAGTTYYVRAYAYTEDEKNGPVFYGNQVSFKTQTRPEFEYNNYIYTVNETTFQDNWGPTGVFTYAYSTTDGSMNTSYITYATTESAAKTCSDLVANGYSDWFLPSKEELYQMYLKKTSLNLSSGTYWSSTEYDNSYAWSLNISSGSSTTQSKSTVNSCKCVRKVYK
jgi:hypothetical protein